MLATDVFDFDKIQNIKAFKLVFELLRLKVGSPVSYQSIAEDVAISPLTVKKYIEILEMLFIIFRVTPYSKKIARSLLKEPTIYFFDNGLVESGEGPQLENMVAVCLLKHIYAKVDYNAEKYSLHYLRTKDGLEVDFALIKNNDIERIIEVKTTNKEISKALRVFQKKYNLNAIQIAKNIRHEYVEDHITVMSTLRFLSELVI